MADNTIRLDKLLSNAGLTARRGVKQFLKEHAVTVNGKRATESGIRVGENDTVLIDGKKITKPGFVYFLLNKPIGIISTTSDEYGRDTVRSLVPVPERIYPVGRLDKDTHGLVLLTNDGQLTHKLIHPKYHVPKVYRLTIAGFPDRQQLEKLRKGVMLTDGITLPAEVTVVKQHVIPHSMRDSDSSNQTHEQSTLEVAIHEGRNRQVRRMCEAVDITLLDLERIAFGPLTLGNVKRGAYRALTKKEVETLQKVVEK